MNTSQHYREQAELCMQLARATPASDLKDALIALVAEYLERAARQSRDSEAQTDQSAS